MSVHESQTPIPQVPEMRLEVGSQEKRREDVPKVQDGILGCAKEQVMRHISQYVCQRCGKGFSRVGYKPYRFCSMRCYRPDAMSRMEECRVCGRGFVVNQHRTGKYCSRKCAGVASRSTPKVCKRCGKKFQPSHDKQIYCSGACFGQTRLTGTESRCKNCGVPIYIPLGRLSKTAFVTQNATTTIKEDTRLSTPAKHAERCSDAARAKRNSLPFCTAQWRAETHAQTGNETPSSQATLHNNGVKSLPASKKMDLPFFGSWVSRSRPKC